MVISYDTDYISVATNDGEIKIYNTFSSPAVKTAQIGSMSGKPIVKMAFG